MDLVIERKVATAGGDYWLFAIDCTGLAAIAERASSTGSSCFESKKSNQRINQRRPPSKGVAAATAAYYFRTQGG
jgi:hypothetical protein